MLSNLDVFKYLTESVFFRSFFISELLQTIQTDPRNLDAFKLRLHNRFLLHVRLLFLGVLLSEKSIIPAVTLVATRFVIIGPNLVLAGASAE